MSVIFTTRFDNTLDSTFPAGAPYSSDNRILGRGIDGGRALTCGSIALTGQLATFLGSNYTTLTSRIQWGLAGVPTDSSSGISDIPGVNIMSWIDPVDINTSNSNAFNAFLTARENGAIMLWISSGGTTASGLHATSAASTLVYDGRMHGIQVSFSFSGHTSVGYNVVVNNVSVLSGSFTANLFIPGVLGGCPDQHTWAVTNGLTLCLERAAVTVFGVYGSRQLPGGTYHWQTSIAEIQLDDTVNIISYPPCNAINATETDPCASPSGGGSTAIAQLAQLPIEIVTGAVDLGGIYYINPQTTRDKYNNGVELKIPNPTIKSALLGE